MSNRVKGFRYRSAIGSSGRPRYSLPDVPKRDLDERDVARLSPEQYETVRDAKQPDGKPLYEPIGAQDSEKAAPKAKTPRARAPRAKGAQTTKAVSASTATTDKPADLPVNTTGHALMGTAAEGSAPQGAAGGE